MSVYFSSDRSEPDPIPCVGDWVYTEREIYYGDNEAVLALEGAVEEIDLEHGTAWIVGDDGKEFEARLADLEILWAHRTKPTERTDP